MKRNLLLFEMVLQQKQRYKKVNFYRYIQTILSKSIRKLKSFSKFHPAKRRKQNSWTLKETFISSLLTYLSMTIYNFKCFEDRAWQRCFCLATPFCVQGG